MAVMLSVAAIPLGAQNDGEGEDLSGANLQGADLRDMHWPYANLQGADLSGANLQGVNLQGANLDRATLEGATLLAADLTDAIFGPRTILPDGTRWTPEADLTRFTDPTHPDFWSPCVEVTDWRRPSYCPDSGE